jgi:3-deoxy-manno-octulosonate cytidylyltransferase (CMP-KDO synthetase)
MWYGVKIHVAQAQETIPAGVDTQADLERVRQILNPSA